LALCVLHDGGARQIREQIFQRLLRCGMLFVSICLVLKAPPSRIIEDADVAGKSWGVPSKYWLKTSPRMSILQFTSPVLRIGIRPANVQRRNARGGRRDQGRARASMTHSPFVAPMMRKVLSAAVPRFAKCVLESLFVPGGPFELSCAHGPRVPDTTPIGHLRACRGLPSLYEVAKKGITKCVKYGGNLVLGPAKLGWDNRAGA